MSSSNLFRGIVFNQKKADVEYLNVGRSTLYGGKGMIEYLHMERYCATNEYCVLHGRVSHIGWMPVSQKKPYTNDRT